MRKKYEPKQKRETFETRLLYFPLILLPVGTIRVPEAREDRGARRGNPAQRFVLAVNSPRDTVSTWMSTITCGP